MFVKHVEFAEKFGALEELQLDSINYSFVEQFHLDLIALAMSFLFAVYYLTIWMVRRAWRFVGMVGAKVGGVARTKKVD